jgi:CRISPR-associated protein Cas2
MRRRYIVSYDVADQKRLRRIYKKMCGFGDPLQLSVFHCELSETEKILLLEALSEIVNSREDCVMIIDLGVPKEEKDRIEFIGKPLSPPEDRCAVIV